jgi:hypothetical protein
VTGEHATRSADLFRAWLRPIVVVTLTLMVGGGDIRGQRDAASPDQLPPSVRPLASALLAEGDPTRRALLIDEIAEREPSASVPFLIALLPRETYPVVRMAIVNAIGHSGSLDAEARLRTIEAVERDPDVLTVARARLIELHTERLASLWEAQAQAARAAGTAARAQQLEERAEDSRAAGLFRAERQQTPCVIKSGASETRFVVIGDFGTGAAEQFAVANALAAFESKAPADFGLTVGDNFYPMGVHSVTDKRWQAELEKPYGSLGIEFYPTFGNHDWDGWLLGSLTAEREYSSLSKTWEMPSNFYRCTAGLVEVFALDTDRRASQSEQFAWLTAALDTSQALWKVVFGHHPIFSGGEHGDTDRLIRDLLPILKGRAQVYIGGHDHDMQYLVADGVHLVQIGGSGRELRDVACTTRSRFAGKSHGFGALHATADQLDIRLMGSTVGAAPLYACTLTRVVAPNGTVTTKESCENRCQ